MGSVETLERAPDGTETATPATIVRTIFDLLDQKNAEALIPFAAPDLVEFWPVVGRLEGPEAVRNHFAAIFASMRDWHISIERLAADGETVFVHWHATGLFTGSPFLGIVPTGKRLDLRGTDCFTIRDGRVVANFVAFDGMDFAIQLGVLPRRGSILDRSMTGAVNLRTRVLRRVSRRGDAAKTRKS